jgi:hypothetical protein
MLRRLKITPARHGIVKVFSKNFKFIKGVANKFIYHREFTAENVWMPERYRYKSPFAKHNHDLLPDIEEDMSKETMDENTKQILKEVFKPRKTIEELMRMSLYDQMKVIYLSFSIIMTVISMRKQLPCMHY